MPLRWPANIGDPAKGATGLDDYLRQGAGFGNLVMLRTRLIIVRKLADGQQFRIRVDLGEATFDAKERILIQPEDILLLYLQPFEAIANVSANFFNFTFVPSLNN